ncbi:hypothetical protein [Bacillus cihuensis]|uniref:hypothetical protein n=1 Tax=Bacillus cihuensis TaxID=1208599 RepID=UPI000685D2CB|nr:hypothetical protein [Bacillus cihuensis]
MIKIKLQANFFPILENQPCFYTKFLPLPIDEYFPFDLGTIVENKLAGVSLLNILMAGCNNNQEPPPPENNVKNPAPVDEDVNDANDLNDQDNGTAPGVDKNDNLFKDENENDPEDSQDITDPDSKTSKIE